MYIVNSFHFSLLFRLAFSYNIIVKNDFKHFIEDQFQLSTDQPDLFLVSFHFSCLVFSLNLLMFLSSFYSEFELKLLCISIVRILCALRLYNILVIIIRCMVQFNTRHSHHCYLLCIFYDNRNYN